ncbi:hypothetical protein FPQ18DRAFT_409167 [Pyronema domesticum]|nr:hypothetical protein FPQ18DRAFT_409167 [Pyronema domesticum]
MEKCMIITVYETEKTKTVEKTSDDRWERCGEPVFMVPRQNVLFLVSAERHRIPISADHSQIVKFTSQSDDNYRRVVHAIKDILRNRGE